MILPEEREMILDKLREFTAMLSELGCDSIRTNITLISSEGTERYTAGSGNFYAQMGSTQEWLESCKIEDLASAINHRDESDG